jgi:class 3 adenylate cyclase
VTVDPRTNGFLFADLRDYTRYVERHGDAAAAALLEAYRTLVRAAVADYGGAEIKTEGDSFYVVFPSASSAVRCGLAILRAASESDAQGGGPIRVGIGVHAGETVETSEGYVGSAVNIAARVCSQASAGELLVTDTVRGLIRTSVPVRFTDRRSRRLKGIAEPVTLYRVEALPEGMDVATPDSRARWRGPPSRWLMLLSAAGGLLAVALAVGVLWLGAGDDARDGGSGSPSMEPSSTPVASGPTAEEADLLNQVPASIRAACAISRDEADSLGGVATVRCDLAAGEPADVVWYVRFASRQVLDSVLTGLYSRHGLPRGQCGPDLARAQGNWQVGTTHAGRLLCFADDGQTWVLWTYDVERILVRASRTGEDPEDWSELLAWWEQTRLFLR